MSRYDEIKKTFDDGNWQKQSANYFEDVGFLFDEISRLTAERDKLKEEGDKDYKDMRRFQGKFIEADQRVTQLEDALREAISFYEWAETDVAYKAPEQKPHIIFINHTVKLYKNLKKALEGNGDEC